MTIDNIIAKYGTHDLDISFCIKNGMTSTILTYCHQHDVDGQFMVNHYLKINGTFEILEADVDDESDVYIHIAAIEKSANNTYEISGVGGYVKLSVEGELIVEEMSEKEYNELLN